MIGLASYFLPYWRQVVKAKGDWHRTRWQPVSIPVTIPDGPKQMRYGHEYQPTTLAFIFVTIPTTIEGVPLCDVAREIDECTAHWYKHNPPQAVPYERGVTRL